MLRRIPLVAAVLGLVVPSHGLAKSGFVRPTAPKPAVASVLPVPKIAVPQLPLHQTLGGCGRGRLPRRGLAQVPWPIRYRELTRQRCRVDRTGKIRSRSRLTV